MTRSSGLLLHPTSLPGRTGIGALGADAERFVDLLEAMEQSWWQMLPVGPTGYADSPYQSPSTFAGNPLLISLDDLVDEGLLPADAVAPPPFPADHVDFAAVIPWHAAVCEQVAQGFGNRASPALREQYDEFVDRHGPVWLEDFAVFTAIKRANRLAPWWEWPAPLAHRAPRAIAEARAVLAEQVEQVRVEQFLFDLQFRRLRDSCHRRGIELIGDIPIFVAHDSADVWSHRDLYLLDAQGMPTVVAGVPPDYFSTTGQRWGNPLYDWDRHRHDGFAWWTDRMRRVFDLFDLVRIDHFRGFEASWHIPADEPTAVDGEWVPAPGVALFDHLKQVFGRLPVIAEDLGVITPAVVRLRDRYGFPGMKVLQFGFGTESHHALDQFRPNVVAYTGTHDNDTAMGWYRSEDPDRRAERLLALETLHSDGDEFNWDLIAGVMRSVADTAVVPLQDLLGLDTGARMNTPATTGDNWRWRFTWDQIDPGIVERMRTLTRETGRSPR